MPDGNHADQAFRRRILVQGDVTGFSVRNHKLAQRRPAFGRAADLRMLIEQQHGAANPADVLERRRRVALEREFEDPLGSASAPRRK